jgi:outer membrane protein, heavy metal efflux system
VLLAPFCAYRGGSAAAAHIALRNLGRCAEQGGWMRWVFRPICFGLLTVALLASSSFAQTPLSWREVRAKFEASNPTLRAGTIGIDEARAEEITAYLRPNPNLTILSDQIDPFPGGPPHGAFAYWLPSATVTYLHEREHKRELRLQSAQQGTQIAASGNQDLERMLLFNLRMAFVQVLQEKALLKLAEDNLAYYDRVLEISRERYRVGDIARVDLDRLELQRVQYESDLQTADVGLRTAKIQLLMLLDDRTPIDQFDVDGPFDFVDQMPALDDIHQIALDTRPDLREAMQSFDQSKTNHLLAVANGSTDPTFGVDFGRNPPIDAYFGVSVSIPLRVFDRNQGEKKRTELDIDRNQQLLEATRTQVFSDVDSSYAMVKSNVILLRPYKTTYLQQATSVRDTIEFSYQHGAASLLDFLNAQSDYRSVQVAYLNLIGDYLTAVAQLTMAVGREVIP